MGCNRNIGLSKEDSPINISLLCCPTDTGLGWMDRSMVGRIGWTWSNYYYIICGGATRRKGLPKIVHKLQEIGVAWIYWTVTERYEGSLYWFDNVLHQSDLINCPVVVVVADREDNCAALLFVHLYQPHSDLVTDKDRRNLRVFIATLCRLTDSDWLCERMTLVPSKLSTQFFHATRNTFGLLCLMDPRTRLINLSAIRSMAKQAQSLPAI